MTTQQNECACPPVQVVAIPGAQGAAGANGNNGANGNSGYTTTTGNFNVPAAAGNQVTISVANTAWMAVGGAVVVSGPATFSVVTIVSATSVTLSWLNTSGDLAAGTLIASGATVGPAGRTTKITGVPAITDNTTGAATSTLAAGVGVQTLSFYFQLSQMTAASLLLFTPGYNFKVLSIAASVEVAATTAAKAITLTPFIAGVSTTGGALALTSANCTPKGASIAGSAITAANTGTSAQTLELRGSGLTAFAEGTVWVVLTIQNMDAANAAATLASKINSILSAFS